MVDFWTKICGNKGQNTW